MVSEVAALGTHRQELGGAECWAWKALDGYLCSMYLICMHSLHICKHGVYGYRTEGGHNYTTRAIPAPSDATQMLLLLLLLLLLMTAAVVILNSSCCCYCCYCYYCYYCYSYYSCYYYYFYYYYYYYYYDADDHDDDYYHFSY